MTDSKKMIPLSELTLLDRFLFDTVMENEDIHKTILQIILGRDIALLTKNQTEKELRTSPLLRSIRMDVYAMDEEKIIYNSEMQKQLKYDLPKRSRFYQSLMDASLLEPGSIHFNLLNDTYIIVITPYDIFGLGKYKYTFRARCDEALDCILPDGAVRMFLNTRGNNREEVGAELAGFLEYAEKTDEETMLKTGSDAVRKIHEHISKIKASEEMGVRYMQAWEEKVQEREEGRSEGRVEGRAEGRNEGIEAFILDNLEENKTGEQILQKLMKRFSLSREEAEGYLQKYIGNAKE